ncbi:MAG: phosphate starvation-inducible protein PhoH [Gammaproteobacteria bacterium RIFCSPHIGHO2_12_FULL_45_9]|nr:MAG: phosphate starvation-inducible protein PhoH [Gammaproteobacteria bacterium RIFCSPHIGHO2_12_FULL_45_9]
MKSKNATSSARAIQLSPEDNARLSTLCGQFNDHLHLIERQLGVEIANRGHDFHVIGIPGSVEIACRTLEKLYAETATIKDFSAQHILLVLKSLSAHSALPHPTEEPSYLAIQVERASIKARTPNQQHYVNAIGQYDINFGIGPSGTGKTYLAVACALNALERETVSRIVLVRPAVEAGESLGFLPGDLTQKIDPYLRPLYDALYEMLGVTKINQLLSKGIIEIASLAYMRGRTLNDSFIILDEGQNATKEQMKMFLTRIGFGSRAVITGDITQTDLPKKTESGLRHAIAILQNIEGIHFTFFKPNDIVRHPIVQRIIEAYEEQH